MAGFSEAAFSQHTVEPFYLSPISDGWVRTQAAP